MRWPGLTVLVIVMGLVVTNVPSPQFTGAGTSIVQVHGDERYLGTSPALVGAMVAQNLTWNATTARPAPLPIAGRCGRGLSAGAALGGDLMVFVANYTGPAGSCTSTSFTNDTLLYNESNNTWWSLASKVQPPPVANFSLSVDPTFAGGVAILFDGENPVSHVPYNGTWLFYFSNETWRHIDPAGGPSARVSAAVGLDPMTHDLLVFGGINITARGYDDDWWSLNLSTNAWSYIGVAPALVAGGYGVYGASVISESPGHLLVFGGCSSISLYTTGCSNQTATLYAEAGGGWGYALNATSGPTARAFSGWAWDPAQGVALLFGGETLQTTVPGFLNDTWIYHPTTDRWIRQAVPPWAPSPRFRVPLEWLSSPTNETAVLVGGVGGAALPGKQLWRLSPSSSAFVTVTNQSGGDLAGARVDIDAGGGSWQRVTNVTGVAEFVHVPSGILRAIANASGYYQNQTVRSVLPNSTAAFTMVLVPLPVLRVRTFTQSANGRIPLGAVALLWDSGTVPAANTDARGYYNFTAGHGGKVTITGEKKGYETQSNNTTLPVVGVAYLNLTLPVIQPANLTVEVRNPQKAPIDKVTVDAVNISQGLSLVNTTNTAGYANFSNLPGYIWVSLTAIPTSGYYSNSTNVALSAGNRTWVNITLQPWPELHVHVLGTVDGGPKNVAVNSAAVYRNLTFLGATKTTGWYNLTSSPGPANISATATGFYSGYRNVVLNRTGVTNVTIVLTAWPSLHVRVFGNQTAGFPIALAGVAVANNLSGPIGATGPLGWLNVTVTQGPEHVSVSKLDYHPQSRNVVLNRTGILNVTFYLAPFLANISVHVLTTLGANYINGTTLRGLGGAQVNITATTGRVLVNLTNFIGYLNTTIVEGNYSFSAWEFGYKHAPSQGPLYANASKTTTLTFVLYPVPGANVNVLIHDRNTTAPIHNATVEVGLYHQGLTNIAGWANFTDVLPPARYTIFAVAAGYRANETNVTLTYYQVIPRLLMNLTKLTPPPSHGTSGNNSWSLVPPQEQYTWWPFLLLPLVFAIGAFVVIVSQRSGRRS